MVEPTEGLWLSLADLARERGISRQSLGERVARLVKLGHLKTRAGTGRSVLVNVAEFDHASAATVDGVRSLNGGGNRSATPSMPITSSDPVLVKEQARRAAYDADLKRLDLLERLNLVMPVDRLEADAREIGAHMVQALDRLPAKLDEMMAACSQGPMAGRRFLRDLGIELRTMIATNIQKLAEAHASDPPWDLDDVAIPEDVHG